MTYTYALLTISKAAHDEIAAKLKAAGYDRANGAIIDMHGLALEIEHSCSTSSEGEKLSDERLDKLISAYGKMSFERTYAELASGLRELKAFRALFQRCGRDEFDANVDRLKACEHIADGDEGWQKLRNECPSTAAVARLRDQFEQRCGRDEARQPTDKELDELADIIDGEVGDERPMHMERCVWEYVARSLVPDDKERGSAAGAVSETKRARWKKKQCPACAGVGSIIDSTYNRTGETVECGKCFGTGKCEDEIRNAVRRALIHKDSPDV